MTASTTGGGALRLVETSIGYTSRSWLRGVRTQVISAGLTASAAPGELTVLFGPNGAGKSTLLRTVAGLQDAVAGSVQLGDRSIGSIPRSESATTIACVLTDRFDPGLLTGFDLVALGRTPHLGIGGRLSRTDREIIDTCLTSVDGAHLAGTRVARMSDGERQRVLVARALAQEPTVLVLDEPTAFLDVSARVGLLELMRRTAADLGLIVLLSTHDLEPALRVADHVWVLDPVHGLSAGTPEEVVERGWIGRTFDSPSVRFDPSTGVFVLTRRG